jgi:hypothetical protein
MTVAPPLIGVHCALYDGRDVMKEDIDIVQGEVKHQGSVPSIEQLKSWLV